MTLPFTPKQEAVWRFIRSCERSPTRREIEGALDLKPASLFDTLLALKGRGYVAWKPGTRRSLVALNPNPDLASVPTEQLEAELARRAA